MHEVKMSQNNQTHKDYLRTRIGDRLKGDILTERSVWTLDIFAAPIQWSARIWLIWNSFTQEILHSRLTVKNFAQKTIYLILAASGPHIRIWISYFSLVSRFYSDTIWYRQRTVKNYVKLTFKPIKMTLDKLFDATGCGLGITKG